jgi:hypothetical protein
MIPANEPKRLSLPILKLDRPACVRITSPIFTDRPIKGAREWIDVINLDTGEAQRIAARTVLVNELRTAYPDDAYVGLDFKIRDSSQKKENVTTPTR